MSSDIEVIAEIGVNHNGDLGTAFRLIEAAAKAGCNTAKFQLWDTHAVYPSDRWDEMFKLELPLSAIDACKTECKKQGLRFLCTPDTFNDAVQLVGIGVDRIKIGSSNVTNLPMLRKVADLGLPTILSTGACSFEEMRQAVHCFDRQTLTVMHCVSAYPPPMSELNLGWIARLDFWDHHVGFSDHTTGTTAALLALAMGARTFEKHLTLHQWQVGPDHKASADPAMMAMYVRMLHDAVKMIGDGDYKRVMPCEMKNRREYERFVEAAQHADGLTPR